MRFLALILSLGLFSAIIYGMFYAWGHSRSFAVFENEFLKKPKPWVILPSSQRPSSEEIPWVEVEQNKEGLLVVPSENQTFSDWFQNNSSEFLAIHVLNSKAEIHEQISNLIPASMEEKILIQSEADVILASLKKLRARWAYGSSIADRVRWKSFDSLGLVSAVTFNRDIYFTPLYDRNGDMLSDSIVNEVRRRRLNLIIGPLKSIAEVQEAKKYQPDGYFILSSDLRSQIN